VVARRCKVVAGPPACLPKSGASCPLHLLKVLHHGRRAPAIACLGRLERATVFTEQHGCRTRRRRCRFEWPTLAGIRERGVVEQPDAADEARAFTMAALAADLGVLRTQRTNGKEQVGWLSRAKRRVGQGSCRAYSRVSCLFWRGTLQGRRRPISLSAQTRRVMPLALLEGPASLKARASTRLSRTAAGRYASH